MITFTGNRRGDVEIKPPIGNRYLDIIIPRGSFANATNEMDLSFARAQTYANSNNIQLRRIEK